MNDVTWRLHPVYFDYEVSTDGRVRTIPRWVTHSRRGNSWVESRELVQSTDHGGYPKVSTHKRWGKRYVHVHVLVCETYHGLKSAPGLQVRHLNGNPADNRPENLAWGTAKENTQDMLRHGRAYWKNQTHCIHGHQFSEENTRVLNGVRHCRACDRRRQREYKQRKREAS